MNSRFRTPLVVILSVIAVLSISLAFFQYRQARAARLQLQASRQRALFGLISYVENMEGTLAKARAASTPVQKTTFLTACWAQSQAARDTLGQIAMADVDLSNIRQFIARVGDYALVLSQKVARGDAVTAAEWSELERLEMSVRDLARVLSDAGQKAMARKTASALAPVLRSVAAAVPPIDDTLNAGFSELDTLLHSVTMPLYDGPFSEANQQVAGLAVPGPTISEEDAKKIAMGFFHPNETFQSVRIDTVEGAIPCFMVTAKRSDGSEVTVSVARQGGAVVWASDSRQHGPARLDVNGAREKANQFLRSRGFAALEETGWRKTGPGGSRVVFTLVPVTQIETGQGALAVRLYPDMVKVEVALDTGDITAFDQRGYLTKHGHPGRQLRAPTFSEQEARSVLRDELKVAGSGKLCVIPLLPTREIMAWEFKVQHGADSFLVYINAMTGKEEVIFQIISDENGAVTL